MAGITALCLLAMAEKAWAQVTRTGTGFTGATGVTIGGTAATSVTVVNATTITCTTPAGNAGTGTTDSNNYLIDTALPTVPNPIVDFAVNEDAANVVRDLTVVFTDAGSGATGATKLAAGRAPQSPPPG